MAQYKVPQNVDIEDKVIAGLTLRQFAFLMFAGGIILVLKYVLIKPFNVLFIPCAVGIGGLGFALAFLRINDRPFEIFLLSAGKTFLTPARRVWQKEINVEQKEAPKPIQKEEAPVEDYQTVKNKLERVAMIVDTGGKVPGAQKRLSNFPTIRDYDDDEDLHDVLEKTEKPSDKLDELFDTAIEKVGKKKKEPPISSLSSMPVSKDQYTYDKMELKSEDEVNSLLEKAAQRLIKKDKK